MRIIVIRGCFVLADDVFPQTPISFLSWAILQPPRIRLSVTRLSVERYVRGGETIEGTRDQPWWHTALDLVMKSESRQVHHCQSEADLDTTISHGMGKLSEQ